MISPKVTIFIELSKMFFQLCHSEPRSGEESLLCPQDSKREERFFAPVGSSE
jgi:hypothetical protein